ncbi:MAG: sensor histidine kinase [Spirochaetaceae bacterium]|jgi:two-component system sensor histidine kinase YesM|nr:sensor histidine kinase [Spirochaetaceae bacterium]
MLRRLLPWLRSFFVGSSIKKNIKTSHVVIIGFMLLPLLLSVVMSLYNTITYDKLITNVNKTNRLNQIVKTGITNELWDIVAGNKSFNRGTQYDIIRDINHRLGNIMSTTTAIENRQLLEVAGRAMGTLERYVDRLGLQMERSYPVIENEQILDEIRGVSLLVSEILQDFIVLEIESSAAANEEIKRRAFIVGFVELAVIGAVTAFSIFVQMSTAANVERSIGSLVSLSSSIAEGDLSARAEVPRVKELNTLTENLNTMAGKIKGLIEANIEEQRNLQKSEMKALQAQITPHFLYNTLDSIIWLAEGNQYAQVVAITRAFSNFFRISLNRGNEWLSVAGEFQHVESYLTIQKIRYRDILDYSIEYERGMADKVILKLLLQPLVENALYHGIKNKRGKGTIVIKGWLEEGHICFSVEDNGIGIGQADLERIRAQLKAPPNLEPGSSAYGLYNVNKRLELYYNRQDLLEISSVYTEGTRVRVKIPEVYKDGTGH